MNRVVLLHSRSAGLLFRSCHQKAVAPPTGANMPDFPQHEKPYLSPFTDHTHHTEYSSPDWDHYRRASVQDPFSSSIESDASRKLFSYTMQGVATGCALVFAKTALNLVVAVKGPAKDAMAAGVTEIDVSAIPEGVTKLFTWRKKPIFVRHRTAAEVSTEVATPASSLRHPETDAERVKKDEWLVVIGVCTHLGCTPLAGKGEYAPAGWFCPCHGSHYDGSGRIRKGPAPLNLEIPPYSFSDEGNLMIGVD